MTDQAETETAGAAGVENGKLEEGWSKDRRGRLYVKRPDGKGAAFRRGEETIAEALARSAADEVKSGRDKRPRPKSKRPKMPAAPAKVDLKQLEATLAEALQAPAMPCAMFGDRWAADHFTRQGPYLARNLVLASEHNPWLRRKLEDAATGQDAAMKLISLVGVAGALFGYAIPPVVYWFNLPVPDKTRAMFSIPPARVPAEDAEGPAPPAPAAEPVAA